ncbi:MAG: glucosamine-6-phosphate deaminase [Candidatus Ornithospirochaeta sp.]|nr:glucosamine-6-phosphate deaminase [Candidatus Ornithospirochaeta sp.]
MRVIIEPDYASLSVWAARYIAERIRKYAESGNERPFVLGLPTGSTPIGTYKELIRLNKEGYISFRNVITFNMDEYVGLPESDPQSYHSFMFDNFFSHIDIDRKNINILNGNAEDLEKECQDYEDRIKAAGGIDLFLGGMGADGHIAFNEPFSSLESRTRIKSLTYDTKLMNARFFGNDVSKVPSNALTVGVGTVMDSREVIILVNGHAKARALKNTIESGVSQMWTCSALQMHRKAIIVADESACDELMVSTYRYFKDIEKDNL